MTDGRITVADVRASRNPDIKDQTTVTWTRRLVADACTPFFYNRGWSGNGVTLLHVLLSVAALVALLFPYPYGPVLAAMAFYAGFVLDCVDGDLARLRGAVTYYGKFIDGLSDAIYVFLAPLFTGIGLWLNSGSHVALLAGVTVTTVGLVVQMLRSRLSFFREWMVSQTGPLGKDEQAGLEKPEKLQKIVAFVLVNGTFVAPVLLFFPGGLTYYLGALVVFQLSSDLGWLVAVLWQAKVVLMRGRKSMHAKPSGKISLVVPDLRGNETVYLARCVGENWVSSAGPFVAEIERRMAALTGRRHAVATVNGTAALHLALVVAGVKPGDLVIIPDWTFAATANAVVHAGASPFFVDVARSTWTLDPELVAEAVGKGGASRIGAVVAVHALGHPADMDPLRKICGDAGVPLIEDAAGAIGATYKGHPAGGLSDAAMFSFNGNKTVTAGGGGMVVTDNGAWADRLRSLSTQARSGSAYLYEEVGYNYRMTNLNAGVGLAQLERLDEMLAVKRAIASAYDAALAGREDLLPMPRAAWAESGCWMYSVRCGTVEDADGLVKHLAAREIESRVFWQALASQKVYVGHPRLLAGVSESLSGCVVSLPCSSSLTDAEQKRVIAALGEWRGKPCKQAA